MEKIKVGNVEYTNKHGLSKEIVNAITKDRYTDSSEKPSDFSATGLIAPIQQTVLKSRYKEELKVRDVVDDFWAFLGSIAHNVLEEAWHEEMGSKVEERLYADVNGKVISGKMDCYADGVIRDYKTTKVYKVMKGDYSEWEKQLNIYAWLCKQNGWEVNKLEVVAILFNWSEHETYKKGYPECPFVTIEIPLWTDEEQEKYIKSRVTDIQIATPMNDKEISNRYACTDAERWRDLKDFAVMKVGSSRAVRKFDTEAEANEYLASQANPMYFVEKRMTEPTRCMKYCPVSHLCPQFQKELAEQEDTIF